MNLAARILDQTTHGGTITPPPVDRNVLIEGMQAAVAGDKHACVITPNHPTTTPIQGGSQNVLVRGFKAARANVDAAGCGATVVSTATRTWIGD